MESLIVSVVDTFCSTKDYLSFKKYKKVRKPIALSDNSRSGGKWI